jgi:uncharacterized protein YwgA
MIDQYRLLAAVIATHPNRSVVGRTRLQKSIKLLQRLGLATRYGYLIHFYGPYSEDLQSDVTLLETMGMVTEAPVPTRSGDGMYYVIKATTGADPALVEGFAKQIQIMADADLTVLELAATYDAFREAGSAHDEAMLRLRRKKGAKLDNGNDIAALKLLRELHLPFN